MKTILILLLLLNSLSFAEDGPKDYSADIAGNTGGKISKFATTPIGYDCDEPNTCLLPDSKSAPETSTSPAAQ